jgi:hypothetical protein
VKNLTKAKWWKPIRNNTPEGQYFNATMECHDKQLERAGFYDKDFQEDIKRDTIMNFMKYGTKEDRELITNAIDDELDKKEDSEHEDDLEDGEDIDDDKETDDEIESPEIKHEDGRILAYSSSSLADTVDDIVNDIFDVICERCGKQFDSSLGEKLCDDCKSDIIM